MVTSVSSEPNLALLLDPIPGVNPCGESLRYTEVYDQIREKRREEDETLPQGVWKIEIKKADWDQVASLCQDALKTRSKDLQLAAWLTEAWLHLEGIRGLERGLELLLGLTRNFWDEIHPQMNKGEVELRVVPYEWINTRLSEDSRCILISMPSDHAALPYRFLDYNEANRLEFSAKRQKSQGISTPSQEKQLSPAKVSLSIDQTPTAFYRYMDESCRLAIKLMAELEEELRLHLSGQAPGFYRLRDKVEGIQRFAHHILDERGEKQKPKKLSIEKNPETRPQKKHLSGSIQSREQAYSILGEVAAYLERVEPHSPTPYLIHRAITWGGMTLSQVVADTLHKGQDMSLLLDILDVKKDNP
jgi:type VI secretion system protein ImpA